MYIMFVTSLKKTTQLEIIVMIHFFVHKYFHEIKILICETATEHFIFFLYLQSLTTGHTIKGILQLFTISARFSFDFKSTRIFNIRTILPNSQFT